MKRSITVLIISVVLTIYVQSPLKAQQHAFKAAFLYHFTEYINWESATMQTFNFAILETSPLTKQIEIIANEKKIKNKKITVREYTSLNDISECHILFIPENCSIPIETIVARFSGKPVLIVAEETGSGKKGAHINFLITENKLRFEVNMKTFDKSGMSVSSQLLQHAIILD